MVNRFLNCKLRTIYPTLLLLLINDLFLNNFRSRKQSLEPLRKQLDEIDNNIQMERQHLSRIKAAIIGNDEKIIRLVNNINNNNNTKQSSGLRISR